MANGFFLPLASANSGEGNTELYSIKKNIDSNGKVTYNLTHNGNNIGEVISFGGSSILVNYNDQPMLLNLAINNIIDQIEDLSSILTPISEQQYNALTVKDKPLYFIYE